MLLLTLNNFEEINFYLSCIRQKTTRFEILRQKLVTS